MLEDEKAVREREPFWWDLDGRETTFVENMRALRERRGMSQTEFARQAREKHELGFHQPTIQRIEAGERPVKLTEAFAIAEILGTSFQAMMDELSLPFAYDMVVDEARYDRVKSSLEHLTTRAASVSFRRNQLEENLVDYLSAAQRFGDTAHAGLVDHAHEVLRIYDEVYEAMKKSDETLVAKLEELRQLPHDFPGEFHGGRPYLKRLSDDVVPGRQGDNGPSDE